MMPDKDPQPIIHRLPASWLGKKGVIVTGPGAINGVMVRERHDLVRADEGWFVHRIYEVMGPVDAQIEAPDDIDWRELIEEWTRDDNANT
jgi:hypothetical protein